MTNARKDLARTALAAALQLRTSKGKNLVDPICVFDLAEELKIELRFADLPSLEGMYSNAPTPAIIIGSERPAGRRVYTCAHEVGHHHFGHGTRVDEMRADETGAPSFDPDEFLAQSFAGFLLMPKLAVCNAFAIRGWKPAQANPEQIYRIANLFGVTYGAFVRHLAHSLGILSTTASEALLQTKLKEIRGKLIADPKRQLILIDEFWKGRPVDLEVGDLVLAPPGIACEGFCVARTNTSPNRNLFEAKQPGLGRFVGSGWSSFIRVSRRFFVGRSIYRHLEEVADE